MFAHFFAFIMARYSQRNGERMHPNMLFIMRAISNTGMAACTVFLIIGFWKMPAWWCPIVAFLLCSLTAFIPIPDKYCAIAGMALCPIFCVLMYLSLFGVL